MNWWDDALHRATAEVVLVGALAGVIGVQVVLRRLSFFTMALTHATFPGVVAASLIGVNIFAGGVAAGAVVALAVAALSRRPGQNAAAATGVVLSAGFALGAGLVATQSGFSRDLSSLLVGSILTVTTRDLLVTVGVRVVHVAQAHDPAPHVVGHFTGLLLVPLAEERSAPAQLLRRVVDDLEHVRGGLRDGNGRLGAGDSELSDERDCGAGHENSS